MRDLKKHDALLWLVVFQQLWLVHFDPFLFHSVICSLGGPLSHGSPFLVFLIVGIHASGISIPLSLLILLGWSLLSIAPLTLHVQNKEWLVSDVVGMLWNGGGLGTGESDVSIVLLNSVLHRSSSLSDVYLATFTGNPVNYAILFSRVVSVLWSY